MLCHFSSWKTSRQRRAQRQNLDQNCTIFHRRAMIDRPPPCCCRIVLFACRALGSSPSVLQPGVLNILRLWRQSPSSNDAFLALSDPIMAFAVILHLALHLSLPSQHVPPQRSLAPVPAVAPASGRHPPLLHRSSPVIAVGVVAVVVIAVAVVDVLSCTSSRSLSSWGSPAQRFAGICRAQRQDRTERLNR